MTRVYADVLDKFGSFLRFPPASATIVDVNVPVDGLYVSLLDDVLKSALEEDVEIVG